MRKRTSIKKLGRTNSHRKALYANQLSILFSTGKLETTSVKAKAMRTAAERLLNDVEKSTNLVNLSRTLAAMLKTDAARKMIQKYVKEVGKKVSIVKVGYRAGDNAQKSELTLPDFAKIVVKKEKAVKAKKAEKPAAKAETPKAPADKEPEKKPVEPTKGGFARFTKSIKQTFTGGSKSTLRTRSGL